MSDPFIAEVRIMPFNFAPRGWAFCDGQIMPISQNTALFSLVGTTYGGNGQTTFALPNLMGRTPVGTGQGPGLSDYVLGEVGGAATVTLSAQEMPNHSHSLNANGGPATVATPGPGVRLSEANAAAYSPAQNLVSMTPVGAAAQPHNNRQPYLALSFCIAIQGIFPSRN